MERRAAMRYSTAPMRAVLAAVVGLVFVSAAAAQELQRLVQQAEALGARTGAFACGGDGKVLFAHRERESFAPASNMKLLTAAAVLLGLGADHEFVTRFRLENGALV